jgi:hypothetical protein
MKQTLLNGTVATAASLTNGNISGITGSQAFVVPGINGRPIGITVLPNSFTNSPVGSTVATLGFFQVGAAGGNVAMGSPLAIQGDGVTGAVMAIKNGTTVPYSAVLTGNVYGATGSASVNTNPNIMAQVIGGLTGSAGVAVLAEYK